MISESNVRKWADEQGLPNLALAEQDYRLVQILEALYEDKFSLTVAQQQQEA